jgi:hypothetical protein
MSRLHIILTICFFTNSLFGQIDHRITLIDSKVVEISNVINPNSATNKRILHGSFFKISDNDPNTEQNLSGYYNKGQLQLISCTILKVPYINSIDYFFSNDSLIAAIESQQLLPSITDTTGAAAKYVYTSVNYFYKLKLFKTKTNGRKTFLVNEPIMIEENIFNDALRFKALLNK